MRRHVLGVNSSTRQPRSVKFRASAEGCSPTGLPENVAARTRALLLQGICRSFRLLSSDDGRLNERPAERAQLHGLQQTEVQPLPSSMSRGRDRGAGIVLYASLKTFLLYGKDVFVKRTSKPIGSDRTEARGNYGDSLSSHRYLIGA